MEIKLYGDFHFHSFVMTCQQATISPKMFCDFWKVRKFPLTAVVHNLSCTRELPGEIFQILMPGSQPQRFWFICLGCNLGIGIFKSSPGNSNVSPKLNTAVLQLPFRESPFSGLRCHRSNCIYKLRIFIVFTKIAFVVLDIYPYKHTRSLAAQPSPWQI